MLKKINFFCFLSKFVVTSFFFHGFECMFNAASEHLACQQCYIYIVNILYLNINELKKTFKFIFISQQI